MADQPSPQERRLLEELRLAAAELAKTKETLQVEIVKRQQAEEALRQSEARLQQATLADITQRPQNSSSPPSPDIAQWQQAEASLRQQNEYLEALHETALGLMSRLDINELLESIVTRAAALADTEHGYLYLLTPDAQEMHLIVRRGIHFKNVDVPLKRGEGLSGNVWVSAQPLAVNDYQG